MNRVEELIKELLVELGEDPVREGLVETPRRIAESLAFLTSGYGRPLETVVGGAVFTQAIKSMIVVRDIELYSLCEHHMLPFIGRCHIGYIPSGRVLGVSKLARIVDLYARRLQIQERLTEQISKAVMDTVDPLGVGVMIEAQHLCMMMRGVEKQNSLMVTSCLLGSFRENPATRQEFLSFIAKPRPGI
jgi:GTP cyclohydrolase I